LSRIEPADELTVLRLCRLEDESARLRAIVAEEGFMLGRPMQSAKGEVIGEERYAHPALAQLRRVEREAGELCAALGLSPAGRQRIGLPVLEIPREPDELDELRKRVAQSRGEPDAGIDRRRSW
jgi:P27 family predicted phage terminase small subunit